MTHKSVWFKTFFGNSLFDDASDKVNAWLADNPNVNVLDFKHSYCVTEYVSRDSICVMYEIKEDINE
jgi:hypothetical protein